MMSRKTGKAGVELQTTYTGTFLGGGLLKIILSPPPPPSKTKYPVAPTPYMYTGTFPPPNLWLPKDALTKGPFLKIYGTIKRSHFP